MDEQNAVAPETEATETPVEQAPEAAENTDGQVEPQIAEAEPTAEDAAEKSRNQVRREKRKAEMARLRTVEAEKQATEARLEQAKKLAAESDTPPKESDFQDYNAYLMALGSFQATQQVRGMEVQRAEAEAQRYQETIDQIQRAEAAEVERQWQDSAQRASARYADFDRVVNDPTLPISGPMAEVIKQSERGPDIAYYLGTHRMEAQAISQLSPMEQAVELGRISATLSLPQPNMQPKAPDPVAPVKPRAVSAKDPSKMSMAEYRAWRQQA